MNKDSPRNYEHVATKNIRSCPLNSDPTHHSCYFDIACTVMMLQASHLLTHVGSCNSEVFVLTLICTLKH